VLRARDIARAANAEKMGFLAEVAGYFLFFDLGEVRARGVQRSAGRLQQSRKFTREWTRMDANDFFGTKITRADKFG
jgi:hypothetical protein